MLETATRTCAVCARGARSFTSRYRDFLREPGTIFTGLCCLLLVVAAIDRPGGILGTGGPEDEASGLYLASALVGSSYIWWSALQGIRERDFTADIPVSVATAAAIAIDQYSAAAVVAALLLVGGLLESFIAARASGALEALEALLPSRVTVRRKGHDVEVGLSDLAVGDVVVVRAGERVAVDGTVVSGAAAVSQAAITGESEPLSVGPQDTVFAGSLNEAGALVVEASKVGAETTVGQIRRMVEDAQTRKAPIERLLNRYAKVYTPLAILLGALLWWWSGDILRAITMLIVFCPCVMVLATPAALVASIGNAALRGSLVKKGATIESLAKVDVVLFDKTGTLTTGRPRLVEVVSLNGFQEPELLRLAAAAEKLSEHPLGRAIVRTASERGLAVPDPDQFDVLPGMGVRARVDGRQLVVGRARGPDGGGTSVLTATGRTVVTLTVDGTEAGMLVLEDTVRDDAAAAVRSLQGLGLRTAVVSGDNAPAAQRVAAELGIDDVHAEVLPQHKVELVRQLQAAGHRVAFVGDGINDGPALATADVGVAMGLAGTDVAIETAEVALLSDDLTKLPYLVSLSRKAIRAIHQNLVFSLGVTGVAIGLTIPGILTPVTGALLHELSSIPVIGNSVRLVGARHHRQPGPGVDLEGP